MYIFINKIIQLDNYSFNVFFWINFTCNLFLINTKNELIGMTADTWMLNNTLIEIMLRRNFCYIEDINITNLLHKVEFPTTLW